MAPKFFLAFCIIFNVAAQLSIKAGISKIKSMELLTRLHKAIYLMFNPLFLLGLVLYGFGFVTYTYVLSKVDLGIAYPISSIGILVIITLLSIFFLNEPLTRPKIIGVSLCIIGIIFIFK